MVSKENVQETIESIIIPGSMRSLSKLNLIKEVKLSDETADISLFATAINTDTQDWLREKIGEAIKQLSGVKKVDVSFIDAKPQEVNAVKKVVAVMSGKGGVGKSLITSLLSVALSRTGKETGILDADITGPSIPKMFGLTNVRPSGNDAGILPVPSKGGTSIMSINLVLENEDDAVIWRGPLIGKAIQQFWEDVLWGNLDCLLVDLPPGTADAPLTVMQSLPVSGVVLVFSPQELAAMVVRKAVKMAKQMNIPILGVVENMSYFSLPDSGKKLELFGKSRGDEMAQVTGAPLLGKLPVDPQLAQLCDNGEIEKYTSNAFEDLARNFIRVLEKDNK
ncbi:MAG: Mrp/NBP35 family ATP-binding protein [Dehalococcoidia bacterium]